MAATVEFINQCLINANRTSPRYILFAICRNSIPFRVIFSWQRAFVPELSDEQFNLNWLAGERSPSSGPCGALHRKFVRSSETGPSETFRRRVISTRARIEPAPKHEPASPFPANGDPWSRKTAYRSSRRVTTRWVHHLWRVKREQRYPLSQGRNPRSLPLKSRFVKNVRSTI